MTKLLLLTLIGLPATGKTTFCLMLSKNLKINTIHICYDQLFTITSENVYSFSSKRKEMIKLVEHIICLVLNSISLPDNIKKSTTIMDENEPIVILIDDNNYYAGMRYEFYKICKKFKISFGQVYFEFPLETILLRNSQRESHIQECIILKMNDRLEKPCSYKNKWEENSICISSENYDKDKMKYFLDESYKFYVEANTVLKRNPEHPQSKLHLIDLILRKNINERINIAKTTDHHIRQISKGLIQKRKDILQNIKLGHITLPEDEYENFIKNLLD